MLDFSTILSIIDNKNDIESLLLDILTPQEKKAIEDRWEIANLLDQGKLSYIEIAKKLGTSTTTVTRVARFLRTEKNNGYRKALALQTERH